MPIFGELDALAQQITDKQGRAYDPYVLRQTLTLTRLEQHLPSGIPGSHARVCVIRDGFGSMTTLLDTGGMAGTIILVNLTRTLLVDLHFGRMWLGNDRFDDEVSLVSSGEDIAAKEA